MYTRSYRYDEQADYELFAKWTDAHGKGVPPRDHLPRRGVWVGEDNWGPLLGLALIYKDEHAPTGWLGFLTTAPKLGPKKALRACVAALEAAEVLAISAGIRYLYVNVESLGYARLLKRLGWMCNHEVNMEFCKELVSDPCQDGEAFVEASSQRASINLNQGRQ